MLIEILLMASAIVTAIAYATYGIRFSGKESGHAKEKTRKQRT
jgi:hypothetical protein